MLINSSVNDGDCNNGKMRNGVDIGFECEEISNYRGQEKYSRVDFDHRVHQRAQMTFKLFLNYF